MLTTGIEIKRLFGTAFVASVLALGLAACGGGDDEEPAPVTTATTDAAEAVTITTEELIDQGDEICAEVNAAIGSIDASTADEETKASQREGIYEGLAESLGALGSPTDGEPPTDVIAAVQDLADGSTDVAALQTAATDYGFSDCAEAPEVPVVSTDGTDSDTESTGAESGGTYIPPETTPEETYTPPTTAPAPSTGGGVAPVVPDTSGGSSSGGSSGGSSSGGIGPG
ncbi:MAG TPA: hypothetical protein PKD76_00020 [Solirubrobacterales bacterium]|nr:hypothetical protein [Solirubrobacterales bacterium]